MAEEEVVTVPEPVKGETAAEFSDIECRIKEAMRSRVSHFKEQSDSLTFEGVRRLLEKDLGLQEYALDVHKRFVKQCLLPYLDGSGENNASKDSGETDEKIASPFKSEAGKSDSPEGSESANDIKETCSENDEKMEDSPVMGLLTGKKKPKSENEETPAVDEDNKKVPTEATVKKALWKKASYIKANSEKVTMAGLRRLLEEDLGLEKYALDSFKKYLSTELDKVLQSSEVSEPKKKIVKKNLQASKKMKTEASSGSSDRETDDEDDAKPKKKTGPKQKRLNSEGTKKRKRIETETKVTSKKLAKPEKTTTEDNSDAENSGNASDDNRSQSSTEKPVKKKEASTPAYGKRVEHLKSVIKSCAMSVPPVVYKKVKQVPENKREAQLIKELEEILSKEGLSSNPSEKEIKEVRKKKERAKELEGIDMSNIVSNSRRRSTTSYAPPPKPKIPVESDNDDDDNSDEDDEDNDDDDDEEEENDEEDDGDNDGDEDGKSEEQNAESGEDSD